MKMPGTSIFYFPRLPTADEDPFNVRKEIVWGTTRGGDTTLFVRLKEGTIFHDRCLDIIDDMRVNDRRRKREAERGRIREAIRLLRDRGYIVTEPPADHVRNVRFAEGENR